MPEDPYAPTYGQVVEREGWWVVDPIAGGKQLQAVSVLFDDGESWIVHYRVRPGDLEWVDRRVRVKGRPYWPSSQVQHVMATHLEVQAVELAAGQTPWEPVPTEVPAPPMVRDTAALGARAGRWVQAVGVLVALEKEDGGWWARGRLRLKGGELELVGVRTSWMEGLEVGQQLTVLGKLSVDGGTLGARALCAGESPRCGLDGVLE